MFGPRPVDLPAYYFLLLKLILEKQHSSDRHSLHLEAISTKAKPPQKLYCAT
jgi:hypothetical protein